MGDNTTGTPKARVLGASLREAREDRHLGLRKLAGELGIDPGQLSRWETGKKVPKETDVARILTFLGVGGERYDEILSMTTGAGASQWLAVTLPEHRQHMAAILDFESSADTITTVSPLLIPGLLQVGSYVRSIMSAGTVPAGEVATRVAVRIGRRDAITRPDPARLVAFIGEAALRQVIGSSAVMVEQLRHILDVARSKNVDVRVVPFNSDWHPALEGAFNIIDPRDDAEKATMSVVHLENRRSGLFLHEVADVDMYRAAVDVVFGVAMGTDESSRFIADVIKEMESR